MEDSLKLRSLCDSGFDRRGLRVPKPDCQRCCVQLRENFALGLKSTIGLDSAKHETDIICNEFCDRNSEQCLLEN